MSILVWNGIPVEPVDLNCCSSILVCKFIICSHEDDNMSIQSVIIPINAWQLGAKSE